MQWLFDIIHELIVQWGYLTETQIEDLYIGSRVLARRTVSGQVIPNNTWTVVDWNHEDFDTLNEFNLTTNIFIPLVTGYYHIDFSVGLRPTLVHGKRLMVSLELDAVSVAKAMTGLSHTTYECAHSSILLYITAGQTIRLYVYHDTGAAEITDYNQETTFVSIHRLIG